ncbi:hypothetical protein ACVWW1_008524 [Bradyrhizobium sp. JR3.5]
MALFEGEVAAAGARSACAITETARNRGYGELIQRLISGRSPLSAHSYRGSDADCRTSGRRWQQCEFHLS